MPPKRRLHQRSLVQNVQPDATRYLVPQQMIQTNPCQNSLFQKSIAGGSIGNCEAAKKGGRSRAVAIAKIVDSPEIVETSNYLHPIMLLGLIIQTNYQLAIMMMTSMMKNCSIQQLTMSIMMAVKYNMQVTASDVDDYANVSGLNELEDELRTSFQKNTTTTKNRITGGPTPPDLVR